MSAHLRHELVGDRFVVGEGHAAGDDGALQEQAQTDVELFALDQRRHRLVAELEDLAHLLVPLVVLRGRGEERWK